MFENLSILVGGESFSPLLFEEVRNLNIGRINNSYGPSETGFTSTFVILYDHALKIVQHDIDIGCPVKGMDLRIIKEIDNKK